MDVIRDACPEEVNVSVLAKERKTKTINAFLWFNVIHGNILSIKSLNEPRSLRCFTELVTLYRLLLGQFFPFGAYPGYPWGAPMPMEAPPSPASSVRSLNRTGRARRRKKGTSEEDDEELSETSSPMSRPKSSSSDPKENTRAPLATQTTSSEYESEDDADKRRNKSSTVSK